MQWMQAMRGALRRHREGQEREMRRLRTLYLESERLRAELSHLEREIYGIQDSALPYRQKALLESAIRIRCRKVETEMLHRQNEVSASGHVVSHW